MQDTTRVGVTGLNAVVKIPKTGIRRDKAKYKSIADKSKAVCFGKDGAPACPVRLQCLLYSDKMDEQHGIWGGLSHRERNALKRKAAKVGLTLEEWMTEHGVKGRKA